MQADMDGYAVAIGDTVYDTAYGTGRVVMIMSGGRFQVVFPQGRSYVYSGGGVNSRFTIRTLYWRDPVIVIPTREDNKWSALQNVCRAVASAIREQL